MTLLAGEVPCVLCGLAIDQSGSMVCKACHPRFSCPNPIHCDFLGFLEEFRKYRDAEGRPEWFKHARQWGANKGPVGSI